MQIKKASTDQTVYFHLRASADGTSKTGLLFNSAGAIASYVRTRAARVNIPLVTLAAADSAHDDGGFKEIDGANTKGLYRFDIPDGAFASGVDEVIIHIGFTDVFEESLSIELVDERAGNLKADAITAAKIAADAIGSSELAASAVTKIRQSVCLTGDPASSIGKILYEIYINRLTSVRAGHLDNIDNVNLATIPDISTLTAAVIAHLNVDVSSRSSHTAANVRDAILDDATRFSGANIAAILADVIGIDGDPMRGTDGAALAATALSTVVWTALRAGYIDNLSVGAVALASVCTAARLSELNAANIPADIDTLKTRLPQTLSFTAGNVHARIKAEDNTDFGALKKASINTEVDTALLDIDLDHFIKITAGAAKPTIGSYLDQILNKNGAQTFSPASDSLEAIRDRGDAAWITGGVAALAEILNIQPLIPISIDLADTATVLIGMGLTNMLDDLPTPGEITPGTITIDRKAYGETAWTTILNAAACSEAAGIIYYNEVFDSASGYAVGDTIRITFKNQKITVAANDYEITGSDGWVFHTVIREPPKVKISKGEWAQNSV